MSEGRIEQIGTPFEIYNFPATAFVASFVGTLNVLRRDGGRRGGRAGLRWTARRSGRPRPIDGARAGDVVTVALRPEIVTLGDGPDGSNRLRGTIDDVTFLGSIVRIRIRLGEAAVGDGPARHVQRSAPRGCRSPESP